MPVKAILFDIDGTLVDSNEQHITVWDEVFRAEGLTFDHRQIHDQIGKGADMLVPALMPGSDEGTHERLGKRHGEIFKARYLGTIEPFEHARELLVRAHAAGKEIVFASSASAEELEHYIELLDVRELVSSTTTSDDVGNTKPAPDIFAVALQKLGDREADEAIVIGDTPYDVEAAAKCGIPAIALRSGKFSDAALKSAGARWLYDDVAALLADFDGSPLSL